MDFSFNLINNVLTDLIFLVFSLTLILLYKIKANIFKYKINNQMDFHLI
jgi:Leucine-rich repeat (LRR) protein